MQIQIGTLSELIIAVYWYYSACGAVITHINTDTEFDGESIFL